MTAPGSTSAPNAIGAATSPEPLVRFSGVQKTYDGQSLVVRQLDLDIRRGEFLTLLGPSGSGKTTTLMMLAGFESPTEGEILLNGAPITRTPPHRRNFGMVFQNYALFPHLSVGANVAYPLSVRRVPREARAGRVARALDMVRLQGLQDRMPAQLSGGQQQRVALARALVFEPQLVLMDEPLGALDKQLREHMQIELKELHRQLGVTFVYVTHDQGEALTMSDRVAVFNDGRIQQIDAVARLYETPANRFVAGFVGDSTALAGRLAEPAARDRCTVVLDGGTRLTGVDVGAVAAGAGAAGIAVTAAIRPERIEAYFAPPPADATNIVATTLEDTIYYGDHLRLLCRLPGERQGSALVKLPMASGARAAPGSPVWLRLPEEYLRVYA